MVQSDNILKDSTLKNHWKILLLCIFVVTILIIITVWMVFSETDESHLISGVLFIDKDLAPEGVNVTIMFDTFSLYDIDGTDSKGRYQIDVSDFLGLTGTFVVYVNDTEYIANDQFGINKIIKLSDETIGEPVNLYITIYEPDSESDDSSDDSSNNDTDDANDSDNNDSNDDQDQNDDINDTDDGDDVDDDTQNDDDDTENQNDILDIDINKKIWQESSDEWVSSTVASLDDVLYFNLSVENTGNRDLYNVSIYDVLPKNMHYVGNAIVDNKNKEPYYNQTSNSLIWNFSKINASQQMYISYNCSVLTRDRYENDVSVTAQYDQQEISSEATAKVDIKGDITVSKMVWNATSDQWSHSITIEQYEKIRSNISIFYNGSFELRIINITDFLPEGMNYSGNATINGVSNEPIIDIINHSLIWQEIIISSNENIHIEFDIDVMENRTMDNHVDVLAKENIGTIFEKSDTFSVTAVTPKAINVSKKVRYDTQPWMDFIDAHVCDKVQFNVTITNIGRTTIYNLSIIDILPTDLAYSDNSCYIIYQNETFYRKPIINESTHSLQWTNLNYLIHNFLRPNTSFNIFYNATVTGVGMLENNISVSSPACPSCQYLIASDSATINATQSVDELIVSINGPINDHVNRQVRIQAQATGGTSPYIYLWDLDNNGIFDDDTGPIVYYSWDQPGNYSIFVKVLDAKNQTKTNYTYINITFAPLEADAGGPYRGKNNSYIYFNAVANGGDGNYTWFWDFGDGNNSTLKSPYHKYLNIGQYIVVLTVYDGTNQSANDTTIVTVISEDNQPPFIDLEKPINAIYINNRAVIPFFKPLIIGSINITFSAVDNETEVEKMELYINDALVKTIYSSSGVYTWDDKVFKRCELKIKAIDSSENSNEMKQIVWKLF